MNWQSSVNYIKQIIEKRFLIIWEQDKILHDLTYHHINIIGITDN